LARFVSLEREEVSSAQRSSISTQRVCTAASCVSNLRNFR
jgi:hypothetical protein